MSGNGDFVPHNSSKGLPSGLLNIEPGTGGKATYYLLTTQKSKDHTGS